jgi:hypothetical protein
MDVKGSFFVGRKAFIVEHFGEERWSRFIARMAPLEPVFGDPILVTTLIPVKAYFTFNEELIKEFFNNDDEAYWTIGEKSAEWALTEGPYKNFRNNPHSVRKFIEQFFPLIWTAYYTEGRVESLMSGNEAYIWIADLPVRHLSIEYAVLGWAKRALELVGLKRVAMERIRGISAGDRDIYYRVTFDLPA